jgi:tetratricopeptide (TPR) repeat protein
MGGNTQIMPRSDQRESLPVVTPDPVRLVLLLLIMILVGIGVYAAGMAAGLWLPLQRLMKHDLLGSMVGLVVSFAVMRLILGIYALIARKVVGFDTRTILRLIQQADYQRALETTHKQAQVFQANLWLDRLRVLVFLDANTYGYRELALLNQAYLLLRLERVDDALATYREVLGINPHNTIAANSLALAAAARGQTPPEVRPPLPQGVLYDLGVARKLRIIRLLLMPLLFAPCMLVFWWLFSMMYPLGLSMVIGIVAGVIAALVFVALYRLVGQRVVIGDLLRGRRLARAGRFEEAAQAYEKQLAFLNDSPRVDEWRAWALLDPTTFSYREMTLMGLSAVYSHLGDGPSMEAVLRRALEINPANGNVWNALEFVRLAREQQETSQEAAQTA